MGGALLAALAGALLMRRRRLSRP
ncbi:hypothetical protein ACLM5J_07930 [Nocardioides sp. Bht2]